MDCRVLQVIQTACTAGHSDCLYCRSFRLPVLQVIQIACTARHSDCLYCTSFRLPVLQVIQIACTAGHSDCLYLYCRSFRLPVLQVIQIACTVGHSGCCVLQVIQAAVCTAGHWGSCVQQVIISGSCVQQVIISGSCVQQVIEAAVYLKSLRLPESSPPESPPTTADVWGCRVSCGHAWRRYSVCHNAGVTAIAVRCSLTGSGLVQAVGVSSENRR